jgi:hypothetical protein
MSKVSVRTKARNVHGGVDGSLAILKRPQGTHSRMQVRMCRLPRPANWQNLSLSCRRIQSTLEPFLSRGQAEKNEELWREADLGQIDHADDRTRPNTRNLD